MKRIFSKKITALLIILGICLALFASSSLNSSHSADLSSQLSCFLQTSLGLQLDQEQQETFHYLLRKSAHFFSFFMLGIVFSSLLREKKLQYFLSFLFCFAIAVVDEYHQYLGGTRNGSIYDVILDTAGAMTGIFVATVMSKVVLKLKKRIL